MSKSTTRKWRVRTKLLMALAIVVPALWLASSAFVTWRLTRRTPLFPEPAPTVAWGRIEDHRLRTSDGQDIGAWFCAAAPQDTAESHTARPRTTALLLHGNGGSRRSWTEMMRLLHEQGYDALAISLRAHGDSSGDVNDVGYSARHDVTAAVEFIERRSPGARVVVVASSLGTAAALFAAGDLGSRVDGYFLESPYRDLGTAVWNRLDANLPPVFTHAAYAGMRLWAPVFLPVGVDAVNPCRHAAGIPAQVPVVVFAGADDRHCRLFEAEAVYEEVRSHGRLITVSGGRHGDLFRTHPAEYRQAVLNLLRAPTTLPTRSPPEVK
jgi:alpha-beta hydrolase superfamily lysophospholipase